MMSTYKSIILCLVVVLLACVLLWVSRYSGVFLKKPAREDKQLGRQIIMKEQTKLNIGTKFPEIIAESLAKTR